MQIHLKARPRVRLLMFLSGILLVLAIIDGYQGWRLLLISLAGAWLFSRYWARNLAHGLHLKREMRYGWAQVGDQLEERFTLVNSGNLPGLWVEIVDHSNMPSYQVGRVIGIEGGSTYQWRTQGLCTRRGLFTLGPTTLRTADPLDLYHIELHNPNSVTLMVTPPLVPLPEIEIAPGGRAGLGRPRPNAPERTVSAAGVRQYTPGDSLHWIHWRTTARHDELFVRQFESTPSGDWWIILDADLSVQAGEGARSTEEHGVILAASLADRGLRLGRSVGLATHGETLTWLPPRQGDIQRWEILRALALLEPARRPLAELLAGVHPSPGSYTSLVIITPNTQGDWLESLLPMVWLGAVPTLLVLDPTSFSQQQNIVNDTASTKLTNNLLAELERWGIHYQRITPDLLDRPEAQPGRAGRWEWRVSPTGRAIAVNPPRDTSWKALS